MDSIYKMALGDEIGKNGLVILRVPGGWIFSQFFNKNNLSIIVVTSTFVPFNNEFQ